VQCVNLTDDELLRVIAENTDAMVGLIHYRIELDAEISSADDSVRRSELMHSYVGWVNKFESEYRACTGELRRRHRV
jgi:hypothetical protein